MEGDGKGQTVYVATDVSTIDTSQIKVHPCLSNIELKLLLIVWQNHAYTGAHACWHCLHAGDASMPQSMATSFCMKLTHKPFAHCEITNLYRLHILSYNILYPSPGAENMAIEFPKKLCVMQIQR